MLWPDLENNMLSWGRDVVYIAIILIVSIVSIVSLQEIKRLRDIELINNYSREFTKHCTGLGDLKRLFAAVRRRSDINELLAALRPYVRDTAASENYAQHGEGNDVPDSRSSRSKSSFPEEGRNDFSVFRRVDLVGTESEMNVSKWIPVNEALEACVRTKLFGGSTARLEEFLKNAADLRQDCLRFLFHVKDTCSEATLQALFVLFANSLLDMLPNKQFKMCSVNLHRLTADVWKKVENEMTAVELAGKADVAIVAKSLPVSEIRENEILVIGELKKQCGKLSAVTADQPKDQLLVEMLAVHQHSTSTRLFTKGFLTDLFAISIALHHRKSEQYYVAPRVWDSREYLVRWLFLLCPIDDNEFSSLIKVSAPQPEVRYNTRAAAAKSQKEEAGKETQLGGKSPANGGSSTKKKRKKPKSSQTARKITFHYDIDEIEEFEEVFRGLRTWNAKLLGETYLCAETLESLHANKSDKEGCSKYSSSES